MDSTRRRWSWLALLSLLLGLLSLGFFAATGIFAIWMGYQGIFAVNSSDGQLRGRWAAIAGMALGFVGTAYTIVWLFSLGIDDLQQKNARAHCSDNLRRMYMALQMHHSAHDKQYPAAVIPNKMLPPEQSFSWHTTLLPLLDAKGEKVSPKWVGMSKGLDLRESWKSEKNASVVGTPVSVYLCPRHPIFRETRKSNLTSYVGMAGVGEGAARLPRSDENAGFFGYSRGVKSTDIAPGTSYVLICLESAVENGPWAAGGPPTTRGLGPTTSKYIGQGKPFGGIHPGGGNSLWADGSVQFLSDGVSSHFVRNAVRINRLASLERKKEKGKRKK